MTLQPANAATGTQSPADAFCASGSSPTPDSTLPPGQRSDCYVGSPDTGGASGNFRVGYEVVGNPDGEVVVALGGISANRHVTANAADRERGWWQSLVGPGRCIDTDRERVIAFDYLGSPQSPVPADVEISTRHQADVLAAILEDLGISQVSRFVGASYGGMVALAFAAKYRTRVNRLVLIGAAHRPHPLATAWRSLQRQIVELGSTGGASHDGLRIARGLAMTTYRSAIEFDERFAAGPGPSGFAVEEYLEARGRSFADHFEATSFATLSASIDRHHVDPGSVSTPTDIVAIDTDALVPTWLVEELRRELGAPSRVVTVASKVGHDAFLADVDGIAAALRSLDRQNPAPPADRSTTAVRAAVGTDREHGAVMPPLYLSSNYTFEALGVKRQHDYSRTSNPTRDHLAAAITDLEGGVATAVTSSGMSAVALGLQLLEPDDLVVMTHDCYGGTHRLATRLARRGAFRLRYADLTTAEGIEQAAASRPRMFWVETPSNPLLRLTDLAVVARAARACDAILAVDNTFLSPVLQRPIEHGADLVVHSTTKFINGHSDVVGGAVVSASESLAEEIGWWANAIGLSGSPFDSYLTLRGLRTLDARMRVHQENARAIAGTLAKHEAVQAIYYPGLETHPGHATANRQQDGPGSLLSFELGGGQPAVSAFVDGLQHFALAESLGGVESLIAQPTTMTHAAMEPEARAAAGIKDSLLRLSVGIEARDDLVQDIERGLARASRVR